MKGLMEMSEELCQKYDTPLYITDGDKVIANYRRVSRAFSDIPTRVYYACKANTNLTILHLLQKEGCWADTVSIGELFCCLKAGFSAERIMFTGTSVRDDELSYLTDAGVMINIDSLSELVRLSKISTEPPLSFRVNPGIGAGHHKKVVTGGEGSKFGIPIDRIEGAVRRGKELGFEVEGLHCHIGSGIMGFRPFLEVVDVMRELAERIEKSTGVEFEFIDIGGGFGVPYRPGEREFELEKLAREISPRFRGKTLAIEPGRYIVADSTILLTRVNTIKETEKKTFVGVDAGFNTLIRPAMYGAYHHIVLVGGAEGEKRYDIAGPLCESGDLLAVDRELQEVKEGDLIAIMDVGAYGFSMCSNYNSRPKPAEVMVKDGNYYLIREREKLEDLIAHQTIPEELI
jgi:diaminopimelate decarboxylase